MCDSIPLLYPVGVLFPSNFYAMVLDNGPICGAFTSSLFAVIKPNDSFDNMYDHVKSRLTSMSISKSTNPTYTSYCYDKLTKLSLNHEDTCVVLNRGLAVYPQSADVIRVRFNNDSYPFESIDIKKMIGNLCVSPKYHKMKQDYNHLQSGIAF